MRNSIFFIGIFATLKTNMSYNSSKRKKTATKESRDTHGRFASRIGSALADSLKGSASQKDDIDAPILTVRNPFSYFFHWLDDIKKWIKKDADGEIKIHIPFKWFLVGMILLLSGGAIPGYLQGKAVEYAWWITRPTPTPIVIIEPTLTPAPVSVTKMGTIKATYQVPKNTLPSATPMPSITGESNSPLRYVLMLENGELMFLAVPKNISLTYYLNQRVLITGLLDQSNNTLFVSSLSDLELVP